MNNTPVDHHHHLTHPLAGTHPMEPITKSPMKRRAVCVFYRSGMSHWETTGEAEAGVSYVEGVGDEVLLTATFIVIALSTVILIFRFVSIDF